MKIFGRILLAGALGGLIAVSAGCGRDEAKSAQDAAMDAKESASRVASEAADAAKQTAHDVSAAASDAAEEAGAMAGAAAAEAGQMADKVRDPAARCAKLAAAERWEDALKPCTRAHEANPDDMAIEHALQQAQAASE